MLGELAKTTHLLGQVWNHTLFTVGDVKLTIGNLTMALILLVFAPRMSRRVSKLIDERLINRFVDDASSKITYKAFTFYACLAFFIALSLTLAGIPLTVFTVIGGALAIGIGFGSQNIVNNFISGIILLVEQPVKAGDVVEIDGITGTVITIGTRSTKIQNIDNKIFIVPNSFFLEKSVMNWTFSSSINRTSVVFGVAYGSDVRLVENLCMNILLNTEEVVQEPIPQVVFDEFADSTLTFKLNFWCDITHSNLGLVRSKVRFAIDEAFRAHDIQMAFPQRDINFRQERPLEVRVLS